MSDAQFIEGARTKKTRSAPERVRGTGTILRRFADLVEEGPFGASFLRDRLMDGSLKSHKIARARLVYQRDWEDFLNNLAGPQDIPRS
jgi:hypothetical protein